MLKEIAIQKNLDIRGASARGDKKAFVANKSFKDGSIRE